MATNEIVVARFVVRKDGMPIIGKVLPGSKALKPNRIYQIEEWMGELIIRDLGPSAIQDLPEFPGAPCWGYDFNSLFQHFKEFIMTRKEFRAMIRAKNNG